MTEAQFANPFRPGAGHMPPYLAGRDREIDEFRKLLKQEEILENLILTGLRGVGKTVLLETFRPIAIREGWRWAGADLSESTSTSEETIAIRLITDLAAVTTDVEIGTTEHRGIGFTAEPTVVVRRLSYPVLIERFKQTPGLVADKLKRLLEDVWAELRKQDTRGVIFAYDEAQTISDHSAKDQYPLSLLLDVFQAIQRKGIPFMLAMTGLPTLFPKLVEARTFAERMFHVVFLDRLSETASNDAISKPIEHASCPARLTDELVAEIVAASAGYPYFIQFICREVYDTALSRGSSGMPLSVELDEIVRKLDTDFFSGRWARATDRQRDLLRVISTLDNCDDEFTVQEVVERSKEVLKKPFSASHVNQMLSALGNAGLVYKNRHGKYSFAVPLFGRFILRQYAGEAQLD